MENMRSKGRRGKLSLILLFVGIFAFWWGIAVLTQNGKVLPSLSSASAPSSVAYAIQNFSGPLTVDTSVSNNNVYTYSGSLPLVSSCDQLGTGLAVSGTNPAHVTVLLTLMKPVVDCAEAADGPDDVQPFSVSIAVKPGAKAVLDGVTVNGIIIAAKVETAGTQ